ncbi:MAG: hypothetical protein A2176_11135 [Spirochaetes bacterium RBG_13_51_14]|nr:MAG: hypothetical protein A2176_11135 [Spirochaetes bacterium RBG_13_51_14]
MKGKIFKPSFLLVTAISATLLFENCSHAVIKSIGENDYSAQVIDPGFGMIFGTYQRDFISLFMTDGIEYEIVNLPGDGTAGGKIIYMVYPIKERNRKGCFVINLPAGYYKIRRINYGPIDVFTRHVDPVFTAPRNACFTVETGRILYFGYTEFTRGTYGAFSNEFSGLLGDAYNEDMLLLRRYYPRLSRYTMINRIPARCGH